jgi:uncharacterized protein YoaH (UPF0181 family)
MATGGPYTLGQALKQLEESLSWLEACMPGTSQAEGSALELIQALMSYSLSTGRAILVLSQQGFWREPMALARLVTEQYLAATLLFYTRDSAAKDPPNQRLRCHLHKVNEYMSWVLSPDKGEGKAPSKPGSWCGSVAKLQKLVSEYEPLDYFDSAFYVFACSFSHSDVTSLLDIQDKPALAAVACSTCAGLVLLLASKADCLWHQEKYSAKLENTWDNLF